MFSMIFSILILLLRIVSAALLIYCLLSFVAPGSRLMEFLRPHMEGILYPFRRLLFKWFPALMNSPMDFSPLAVWLVIDILMQLLRMLQRAL